MPWWSDWIPLASILTRTTMVPDSFPDSKAQPVPGLQPTMPGGASAPVRIARHVFDSLHFDLAAAQLPPGTDSILAAWRTGGPGVNRGGALSRLGANLPFLSLPIVLGWWLVRFGRRRTPSRSRWRGWGVLATGLGIVLAVFGASAWFYGRM